MTNMIDTIDSETFPAPTSLLRTTLIIRKQKLQHQKIQVVKMMLSSAFLGSRPSTSNIHLWIHLHHANRNFNSKFWKDVEIHDPENWLRCHAPDIFPDWYLEFQMKNAVCTHFILRSKETITETDRKMWTVYSE